MIYFFLSLIVLLCFVFIVVKEKTLKVFKIDEDANLPVYKTKDSAGMDISSNENVVLHPSEIKAIGTGLIFEIPKGYEAQIRPRSGLALKNGVTVLNTPGTIDADYRGEVRVILANFGDKNFEIKKGDRIAQVIISKYYKVKLSLVMSVSETERGQKGFGSTGV